MAAVAWAVASAGTTVVLVSVLSVLPGIGNALLNPEQGAASPTGVYAAWWMMLIASSALGLVIGVPLTALIVLAWIATARRLPSIEQSVRGVLVGTGTIAVVVGIVAYHVLAGDHYHRDDLAGLHFASVLVGMATWGGLALPRVVIRPLRPGRLLCS